jgi:hypothetical protein
MPGWLLLLNDKLTVDDTLAALGATLPRPWAPVALLAATQRWRPLTTGIPWHYRAEQRRGMHEIWTEQADTAVTRLGEIQAALRRDTRIVEALFVWGDPAVEAHRRARALSTETIVYPIPAGRGLVSAWPRGVQRRLVRNAPCSVWLARTSAGPAPAAGHRTLPTA